MLDIRKARQDDITNFPGNNYSSFMKSNCFVIEEDNDVISIANFEIINQTEAILDIDELSVNTKHSKQDILQIALEDFYWFNPFIKQVSYQNKIFFNEDPVEIVRVLIKDLTPGQLSIDENKLNKIRTWVFKPEDIIIQVSIVNGKNMVTDGHTRLMVALHQGFDYVYAFIDKEPNNIKLYQEVDTWCNLEKIYTIDDLKNWIIPSDKHQKRWIDRCQEFLRNNKESI